VKNQQPKVRQKLHLPILFRQPKRLQPKSHLPKSHQLKSHQPKSHPSQSHLSPKKQPANRRRRRRTKRVKRQPILSLSLKLHLNL
jgi:hypothetical protein